MRSCETQKVAEKLVDLFTRHGVPEEILTDQGANFNSALLKRLYGLLGIRAIRTSPLPPSNRRHGGEV